MLRMWIVLSLLLPATRSFMIYNTIHGLCLQDSRGSDRVQLRPCDLDSNVQQWFWEDGRYLVNGGTARCLSSYQINPVLTASCNGSEEGLWWHCDSHWLVSHSNSLKLTTDGEGLFLSQENKLSKWRSLEEGNICQETLRLRRASDEPNGLTDYSETEYDYGEEGTMTEEQRQYYRWYYRTEDSSPWTYAMLALSSGALLLGCLLFAMGSMANWNRKKIGQYKAAAAAQAARAEELQDMVALKQARGGAPSQHSQPSEKPPPPPENCEMGELRAGDVILKWKDGNVTALYPDTPEENV